MGLEDRVEHGFAGDGEGLQLFNDVKNFRDHGRFDVRSYEAVVDLRQNSIIMPNEVHRILLTLSPGVE